MTEFKRVFIDTAPFIYYLENSSLYMGMVKKFFTKCIEENIQIVISSITLKNILFFHTVAERWNLQTILRSLLNT